MTVCKHCQTPNLRWKQTENGWRLVYESGEVHLCKTQRKIIAKKIPKMQAETLTQEERFLIGFAAQALKLQPKVLDLPPVEALYDSAHPWWAFLDHVELPAKKQRANRFEEIVP